MTPTYFLTNQRTLVSHALFALALLGFFYGAWLVYSPGLSGPFLFDDFANLGGLGANGPIHDLSSFLVYITSGTADPTGRPLTLLSFLIDARDWPADPASFKRTSILLHICNAALLLWTMQLLATRNGIRRKHAVVAATLGSAFWLLHPLFVSTTLYVVQREAMLQATFTFCGMILWIKATNSLTEKRLWSAALLMFASTGLCTVLATLSKANGALLPLLILVTDKTLLADTKIEESKRRRSSQWLYSIFLYLPVALLIIGMLAEIPSAIRSAENNRPWSIGERLLSEPRVVADYLRLLWLPRATSFGVFNDHVAASTGLFSPWSTLPCILLVCGLLATAFYFRKRTPIISFALLFYFAGQLMESTYLPLELAFEHRNYLPAAFMFWPLGIWLSRPPLAFPRMALIVMLLAGLSLLTWERSSVWGDVREQALIWGAINTDSPRAQAYAGAVEAGSGDYNKAIRRLESTTARMPTEVQVTLNLVGAKCAAGKIDDETWQKIFYSLKTTTNGSTALFHWFSDSIGKAKEHACNGLTLARITEALQYAEQNPKFGQQAGRRKDFAHIAGLLALANNDSQTALTKFNEALVDEPDKGTALSQAAALGIAGFPEAGLQHLDFAKSHPPEKDPGRGMPWLHDLVLAKLGYWEREENHLRTALSTDAASHESSVPHMERAR